MSETAHSQEERFFGVKSQLKPKEEAKETKLDAPVEDKASEFEIEIVDDLPKKPEKKQGKAEDIDEDSVPQDELDQYSDQVKRRMAKLTAKMRSFEREAETAKKVEQEAIEYAKRIQAENKKLTELSHKGESALLSQIKSRSEAALESAKRAYRDAFEAGETDKVLEAQTEMMKAQSELNEVERRLQARPEKPPEKQDQSPINKPRLSEKQETWFKRNPWFNDPKHRDMTAMAYGIHEKLVMQGVNPSSDEYYDEIDKTMRSFFPNYKWSQEEDFDMEDDDDAAVELEGQQARQQKPKTVVAPAKREQGKGPRRVTLTASQVKTAKALGITPEQYAAQMIKDGFYDQ